MNRQDATEGSDNRVTNTTRRMEPVPHLDALAQKAVSAAVEVHRHLGPGYLESLYEEALVIELTARGVAHVRQPPIRVNTRGMRSAKGERISWSVVNYWWNLKPLTSWRQYAGPR